jgi:hypothetical protein
MLVGPYAMYPKRDNQNQIITNQVQTTYLVSLKKFNVKKRSDGYKTIKLTFLNSEAHFRMVVEIGGGSAECEASTVGPSNFIEVSKNEKKKGEPNLRSEMASIAQQSMGSFQSARKCRESQSVKFVATLGSLLLSYGAVGFSVQDLRSGSSEK